MTKLKRDRKGQDDENILTFTNFKFIGFQTGVSQTFVKLKAMHSYKLQECLLVGDED